MSVTIRRLVRRFGPMAALREVDLATRPGEFVALLGPSGSGKTTLLRLLAGLDFPDAGGIEIGGQDVAQVPARARGIGFVFQNYALFRHMTVFENVAFGLRVRPRATRPRAGEIAQRVRQLLERMQIPELEKRMPDQISGGQRQRVALARALAIEPRLLLLDEPFGALDAEVRKNLRHWLRDLHDELDLTTIFVTHDQDEAMAMADRVAVMQQGRVVQFDSPAELANQPANAFVAGFIGESTRLPARLEGDALRFDPLPLPPLPRDRLRGRVEDTGEVLAFIRLHEWEVQPAAAGAGNALVRSCRPAGGHDRVEADLAGLIIEAAAPQGLLRAGQPCLLQPRVALVFPS
ncbi:sulfate/molybdate ABC transporter ATP-binding protein [Roseomonas marmotae]|uniref:ATP-binding cassette domain-containing protein n=1 Tax=Roseomonas marmotae TaxID=2768161 RepID=A0ABS3KGI7_9PROT|nr:ATP-binding cassette domain-containing protein [Roseomonas marmotae]MBO1076040.1 ATP-binding cassette domain-containing protein [Roseomonas marmotae]QTI80169.1 ATP-binding cassette domain-containing protein [Roseomonas marmotae]